LVLCVDEKTGIQALDRTQKRDCGKGKARSWHNPKMRRPKLSSRKVWVYDPARAFRQSKARVPTDIQREVQRRAQDLIDSTLKPRYIQPRDKKAQFNYLADIHAKWRGPFFYFCSTYCSPGPKAFSLSFESRFARLQYAGGQRFNLAYFRHTGRWWEIALLLSLAECLSEIEGGSVFAP
jgi:hypothetical protein